MKQVLAGDTTRTNSATSCPALVGGESKREQPAMSDLVPVPFPDMGDDQSTPSRS